MIVYVAQLRSDAEPEKVLEVVYEWLLRHVDRELPQHCLFVDFQRRYEFSQGFITGVENHEYPEYRVMEYRFADAKLRGRYFKLEIALIQYDFESVTDIYFRLTVEDMSVRIQEPVRVIQPTLVSELFSKRMLASTVVSRDVKYLLNESSVLEFVRVIEDSERNLPVVLVSALRGDYFVHVEKLQVLLLGLAHLYVVDKTAVSLRLAEYLPPEYFAFGGAVNIILASPNGVKRFKNFRYKLDQLLALGDMAADEIFSYVLHNTNRQLTWKHFSMVDLRRQRQQRVYSRLRSGLDETWLETEEARTLTNFYEEYVASQDESLGAMRADRDELSYQLEEMALRFEEMEQKNFEKDRLIESLRLVDNYTRARVSDLRFEPRMRDFLVRLLNFAQENDFPTVYEVLELVAYLFSDRLVVLDSAYKSAALMKNFRAPDVLFERLMMLATRYYAAFCQGGDVLAHTVFGYNGFAGNLSDSAKKSSQALAELTFLYLGEPLVMKRHLRIGVRHSNAATIRVYFDVVDTDGDANKMPCIVIGHCGEHLSET